MKYPSSSLTSASASLSYPTKSSLHRGWYGIPSDKKIIVRIFGLDPIMITSTTTCILICINSTDGDTFQFFFWKSMRKAYTCKLTHFTSQLQAWQDCYLFTAQGSISRKYKICFLSLSANLTFGSKLKHMIFTCTATILLYTEPELACPVLLFC